MSCRVSIAEDKLLYVAFRGVFRGGHCAMPPLWVARIVKLHRKLSEIEAWPSLCKFGIRFDHTKGMFYAFLLDIGPKIAENLSEDLFFCSSPKFGRKIGLNLSENLFFFALLVILSKKIELNLSKDLFFCSSPNFGRKVGLNLSRTISSLFFSNFLPPLFSKSCVRYW